MTIPFRLCLGISILALLIACYSVADGAGVWTRDIDFVVTQVQSLHPNPWHRITKAEFTRHAEKLKSDLPRLTEEETVVSVMQLAAILQDGHTQFVPFNHPAFTVWFPVRFDKFDDGLFITAIDKEYAPFVRAKVLRIGTRDAEEAFGLVAAVTSVDSRYGLPRTVPTYLSNAAILNGLGIISSKESLILEVERSDGAKETFTLPSVSWPIDFGWTNKRGIVPGGKECVTAFSDRMNDLPLQLRRLLTTNERYWYAWLPEHKTIYFQFNSVLNGKEPLEQFARRLWDDRDTGGKHIEKFIVDVRYNEGGNGSLLRPLVHEFIKHESILGRGKLFILIGPRTFSAASNFVGQMIKHTEAITVGEPSGPLNWYSDIWRMVAPSGRVSLDVSTMFWQEGHPLDSRGFYPPEYSVIVKSEDYFAGRDVALEKILKNEIIPLKDIMLTRGTADFTAEFQKWSERYASYDWWFPYTAFELRKIGVDLFMDGKKDDAITILRLNTDLYPDIPWAWELLGNVYRERGNAKQAVQCLRRALDLNPYDLQVREALEGLSREQESLMQDGSPN